MSYKHVHPIN